MRPEMKVTLQIVCIIVGCALVNGAPTQRQVLQIRPITREEYNEILKLTNGKPQISEGRLISSGLAVLKNLVTLTNTFWPNIWSMFGTPQTNAVKVVDDQTNNYPLCVVDAHDQSETGNYENYADENGQAAPMDCIIVVRDDEEEEDETQHGEYYEDSESISMMPDYHQWPFAAAQMPFGLPYGSMPFGFPNYQSAPSYYPGFPTYPSPYTHQQSYFGNSGSGYGFGNGNGFGGSSFGNFAIDQQPQQQQIQQADFNNQPNIINPFNSYGFPFLLNTTPAPTQNNANSGPIVHVIRGDKREFGERRNLKPTRLSTTIKRSKVNINPELHKRTRFHKDTDEDDYMTTIIPRHKPIKKRNNLAKVALSRAADFDAPVYIMTTDKLYAISQ